VTIIQVALLIPVVRAIPRMDDLPPVAATNQEPLDAIAQIDN
jgi:hypothetical protein